MEDIPPSYDDINTNILDLLPPYLSTASLVNLCLVSKTYYHTLIPHLWGSPASHFVQLADEAIRTTNGINFGNLQVTGSQNDLVYVALTRFKRVLRRARLSTRLLCHTLHLPPALSEIYGGPNATWLREVLDWLPALQSLCVSGLPFFDHDSLVAVAQSRTPAQPTNPNDADFRTYPTKLLLAAKEPNVTWQGLSLLMPHLPDLIYLDLSYTPPARHTNVLKSLDALTHLQVLKLRGVGLRDNELQVLANVIGLRVRLLDIAENQLSDMAVRSLLQACVCLPSSHSGAPFTPIEQYSRRHFESWPVGLPPPPDSQSLDTIRTVELDEGLLHQLTHPLTGRLAFEDIPHAGITHLYISKNPGITIESIRSVLDVGRLHVLDAGDIGVLTAVDLQVLAARRMPSESRPRSSSNSKHIRNFINRHKSRPTSVHSSEVGSLHDNTAQREDYLEDEILKMPGAEKLVPVLREKARDTLTHLRLDHAVATATLDIMKELKEKDKAISNVVELPGELSKGAELSSESQEVHEVAASKAFPSEMSADAAIFEMDGTSAQPRQELPGDIIHFAISPPVGETPEAQQPVEPPSPIRGEGAMAPEVVQQAQDPTATEEEEDVVLDAHGGGVKRSMTTSTMSTVSPLQSESSESSTAFTAQRPAPLNYRKQPNITLPNRACQLAEQTEISSLTQQRPSGPATKLHPSFLPNLRTLILTNVPCQVLTASVSVIDNLKSFITACAAETRLAILKAKTDYSLPPGRARQDAERIHARTLFALRAVVLEVNSEPDLTQQRGWKHTRQRLDISKSSTGDRDSEALWSAAENDFSFFGEDGEEPAECGIYDQEPDKYYPSVSLEDKFIVTGNEHDNGTDIPNGLQSPRLPAPFSPASPTQTQMYGGLMSPASPLARNGTSLLRSPRDLPLGRNRRVSNDMQRCIQTPISSDMRIPQQLYSRPQTMELPGTIPQSRMHAPTSHPGPPTVQPVLPSSQTVDVIAELAKWRRERKAAYEAEVAKRLHHGSVSSLPGRLAEADIYIEGYWSGEVKVVRNAKKVATGKSERQGNVDIYGNYFEGGYLYP